MENLQPETKSDGRNRSTKRTVYQISVDQATVIGLLLTIVILMVASPSCLPNQGSQGINFTGLILQFVLYAGALLLYGSGGRVDTEKLKEKLKQKGKNKCTYKGYLIDLMAPFTKENHEFLQEKLLFMNCRRVRFPYLFVTNNTTRTPETVRDMLHSFQY